MPTIKTDLPHFSDFPKVKRLADVLRERIQLYVDEKRIEKRLKGAKKGEGKGTGLNASLFYELRRAIPDQNVKSFEFEIEDDDEAAGEDGQYTGRYCVSMTVADKGREKLDKVALISTPWEVEVKCPKPCKCGRTFKVAVMLPPNVLERSMVEGEVAAPTISVRRIGKKKDGEEED